MRDEDTIFALSTGMPPSGVAVVRASGRGVRAALETMIDSLPEPRRASLRAIRNVNGEVIDRGLVLFFESPASFTGEDMAELHVHGGRAVIAAVLGSLSSMNGLRPAEAGEFTRRAFLNRRLDLTEVEGLADLVRAETEAQRRQAVRQAGGELRRLCESWRERLMRVRALAEADLDFADEEDVALAGAKELTAEIGAVAAEIARRLDDGHRGERLREGAEIVILGPPNAGKSSLINALAERDVAIVTPEPGTTRDVIEAHLDLASYPVLVVDTAGLREAAGLVEREGIARAESRARRADLVLWLGDVTFPSVSPPNVGRVPVICVGTKADLLDSEEERQSAAKAFDVTVSVRTGTGLNDLVARLGEFARAELEPGEGAIVTRARHRAALAACRESLERALQPGLAPELRADDIRRATDELGRITGRVGVEDLLDLIFREFCIGK